MNGKKLLHTLKMKQARLNTEHTNKLSSVHARAQVKLQRGEGDRKKDIHTLVQFCLYKFILNGFFPFIIFTISVPGGQARAYVRTHADLVSHTNHLVICV